MNLLSKSIEKKDLFIWSLIDQNKSLGDKAALAKTLWS